MITVRPIELEDVAALADLLDELDRFYGGSEVEPRSQRLIGIEAALFSPSPAAYAVLAWEGSAITGFASYSFLWPAAGVSRSIFLKELYVADAFRRKGVGRLLMQELFRVSRSNKCSRVEWGTEVDNMVARRFYESLGVSRVENKVSYRVNI